MKDIKNEILDEKQGNDEKRREIEEKIGRIKTTSELATTGKLEADFDIFE